MTPVEGIEPIEGWVMMWDLYDYGGNRHPTPRYEAHHPEHGTILFQTSGYYFHPTQDRFDWLLRNGMVQRRVPSPYGHKGFIGIPWSDDAIDAAIEEERQCLDLDG